MSGPLRRLLTVAERATVTPLLLRCGIFLAAVTALSVAYPPQVLATRMLAVLLLVAALPALAPRGRGATLVVLLAVAGWVFDTTWYQRPVALAPVLALATLLYLVHSLAALAAAVPYDAVVAPSVLPRWLARDGAVVLASAVLIVLLLMTTDAAAGDAFLAATVLGIAAAVAAAALPGGRWKRESSTDRRGRRRARGPLRGPSPVEEAQPHPR